ncbi:HBR476Cp [Eremothecium sinecaudum]|uniref:HBR476Cp n=1 Tax=Eremothecium sinecaudum TaxID=45286 RepID=A0A109UXZ6_9SACH|nr:HBR476Cp [Eremothecium sinecaudum]AMD19377.1 HBR476Cp [Eremothecium sinecaudum]
MVSIDISSDLCSTTRDIPLSLTWEQFTRKLYDITGVLPQDMKLQITTQEGTEKTVELSQFQNAGTLSSTFPHGFSKVEVQDSNEGSVVNALKRDLEGNGEPVAGFTLSEEEYARRADSVLNWKKENQLGAFSPDLRAKLETERERQARAASALKVGERCSVKTSEQPERRGWLRFVGPLEALHDNEIWCGVEFDEPVGKNDGSFKGTVYFGPVKDNYGAFVKPSSVEIGPQFVPLIDEELLLSEDMEEL